MKRRSLAVKMLARFILIYFVSVALNTSLEREQRMATKCLLDHTDSQLLVKSLCNSAILC